MRANATLLYDVFHADLVIVSSEYLNLRIADPIDRSRLIQALNVEGVQAVDAFSIAFGFWKDLDSEIEETTALIALPQNESFIADPEIRKMAGLTAPIRSVLVDTLSSKKYGSIIPETEAEILGRRVQIAGNYRMGLALYAKGNAMASAETFQAITQSPARNVNFGLVRLAPSADLARVQASLQAILPDDVLVLEKRTMMRDEQDYYMEEKPVGIIFRAGAFVSFIVGAVIFFQILSTEITNKIKEFATLKAIGFTNFKIYSIGVQQALLYAVFSYIPCALFVSVLFSFISEGARMNMALDAELLLTVLGLTLLMCGTAAFIVLQKVRRADPADLF